MIKIFNEPDSDFPNGVPNPLLPENRKPTLDAVIKNKADLGVAWDGDYDRCFFFDEKGNFIEGYYIVGLLAKSILKKHPGEKIVHDPGLIWNTMEIVKKQWRSSCSIGKRSCIYKRKDERSQCNIRR